MIKKDGSQMKTDDRSICLDLIYSQMIDALECSQLGFFVRHGLCWDKISIINLDLIALAQMAPLALCSEHLFVIWAIHCKDSQLSRQAADCSVTFQLIHLELLLLPSQGDLIQCLTIALIFELICS